MDFYGFLEIFHAMFGDPKGLLFFTAQPAMIISAGVVPAVPEWYRIFAQRAPRK